MWIIFGVLRYEEGGYKGRAARDPWQVAPTRSRPTHSQKSPQEGRLGDWENMPYVLAEKVPRDLAGPKLLTYLSHRHCNREKQHSPPWTRSS